MKVIGDRYVCKTVDLETVLSRINDKSQPLYMGVVGKIIKHIIKVIGIEKYRININLYDMKVYCVVYK